jgi:molybdate transport system regulatory protein
VLADDVIVLGPGKADLLEAIRRSGSLRQAAAELSMSYMRAWELVHTMNASFRKPLVLATRGGDAHGGAALTPTGEKVLALYREMDAASRGACAPVWRRLRRYILP